MSPFGVYVVTRVVCILSPRHDDFNSTALSVFIPEQQAKNISKIISTLQKSFVYRSAKCLLNLQLMSVVKEDTSSDDRVKSS